jgi:hypothetical protein
VHIVDAKNDKGGDDILSYFSEKNNDGFHKDVLAGFPA